MSNFLNMVTPDDVETQMYSWGTFQWMNAPEVTGAKNMIVGIGHIYPGEGHARHNHEGMEEFIYFMSGTAEQMIETPDGMVTKILHAGDLLYVPRDVFHSTYNIGKDEISILVCYQYAGPEAFSKSLSEKIIPAKNTQPA